MSPIAQLRGKVAERGPDWLVVDVGGVGLRLQVAAPTAARLGRLGQAVELYTYLAMRQFSVALYGFASSEERELFEGLISVSGISPKSALGILSASSVEDLTAAIAAGDVERLSKVPGLGRKSASRLVLELKGRLPEAETAAAPAAAADPDVVAALMGLGYSQAEAAAAAATVPSDDSLSVEEKIRAALAHFARRA